MKRIRRTAILAVCLGALGSLPAQAQFGNVAYGEGTLANNAAGDYNTALGFYALYSNIYGHNNTASGVWALGTNTTGNDNSALGFWALGLNTTGGANAAFGTGALCYNTIGGANAAYGAYALFSNTTGSYNTASGVWALGSSTDGSNNTAFGGEALYSNTTGWDNAAFGRQALGSNTTGIGNIAFGSYALHANTTGSGNIGIGYLAGYHNSTGGANIHIGSSGSSTDSGVIRIGEPGTQRSFYAAGVRGTAIRGPVPVYVDPWGQLGTVNSSIRYKEDVHDMADASSALVRLRPVTYRYKQPYADGSKPIDYGLIAEEVAEVYPDLVARDADGQIQAVQYQKLIPMLLNELQKQAGTIRLLQKRVAALEAAPASGGPDFQPATE